MYFTGSYCYSVCLHGVPASGSSSPALGGAVVVSSPTACICLLFFRMVRQY